MIDEEEIHKIYLCEDPKERIKALEQLEFNFSLLPDKQQAWNYLLHTMTNDLDSLDFEPNAFGSVFSHVPDKQQAWDDLIKLLTDKKWCEEDAGMRYKAAWTLGFVILQIPDNQKAWKDLCILARTEPDSIVKIKAIEALGSSFSQVPDKQQAWNDLRRLTSSKDNVMNYWVIKALGSAFSQVPDKQQAWKDFAKLSKNKRVLLRSDAARAFGPIFPHVPDKQKVLNELNRLANDREHIVRRSAADVLGSAFFHIPEKQQAWNYLHKLTNDKDISVRVVANHSLGNVYVFKASQAENEDDYKNELEKAIEFFEKAAQESKQFHFSHFCLPFYRCFHTIVFNKQEASEEIDKYLAEARDAVKGSKSKELLLEAVENLSNALKEVQDMGNLDLEVKKGEINFYRQYCDRAAELMRDAEEAAPFAIMTMRKGLPILYRKLKPFLEEIQEKAKTACQVSIGTATEEIACAVNREVQRWEIGNQEYLLTQVENLVYLLKSYIPKIKENNSILNRIDKILLESDIVKQYMLLNSLIPQIINIQMLKKIDPILSEIKELKASVDQLTASIDELQNPQEYLDIVQRDLEEIKNYMPDMKDKIDEVLCELYTPLSTTQKLKIAIPIIPSLVSYEMETDVPKLVADKIDELKSLVLRYKNR